MHRTFSVNGIAQAEFTNHKCVKYCNIVLHIRLEGVLVLCVLTPAKYLGPVKCDWLTSMSLSPPDAPRCGLPCGGSADRCLAFSNTVIGMQTSRPSALPFFILAGLASYSVPNERRQNRAGEAVCATRLEASPRAMPAQSSQFAERMPRRRVVTSSGTHRYIHRRWDRFSPGCATPADSAPHGPCATDYVDRRSSAPAVYAPSNGRWNQRRGACERSGQGLAGVEDEAPDALCLQVPAVDSQMLTARPAASFR
ncbi:hypothetical protein C8Q74DRAFT_763372 [Fomes fomentarius]|nr:hypothetical protein C8Q74DRAFT_763372 [Fomes fomentarius]